MGGGPFGKSTLRSTKNLERKARDQIRKAKDGVCNVFISFAFEDKVEVDTLRMSAKNPKSPIEFRDYSVKEPIDSARAPYIKQQISERIDRCSTTLVYLSKNSAESRWVDWEIRKSIELGKRVIAVHKGDTPPQILPAAVKENGIQVVAWKNLDEEM
ncbi:TIR domain-containing protein [Desulfovibrio aminophilus]|uniref:TIR domain-containing protein n=1 Tax=Desulfovibrio aminophilus TaxID=81425 RepID=UPI003394D4D4